MYDTRFWLWLSLIFETGSPLCDSLLSAFNHSPKSIYEADKPSLSPFCKNNDRLLSRLLDKRLDRVYSILDFCQKENVGILTPDSRNFPSSLLKIPSAPLVLYYKGRLPDFSRSLGVAVVGTRSVTPYGSSAAYTISHDLASAGAVVVSGMALGADTAAHRGALDAGGHTVAFLGCGIDIVYPKDNFKLMQEIISVGTVITEYAPGLKPEGRHFPIRNRLISGASNAVLVVEAAEKSGALITASHGLRQGKLIYAVPGKVGELSSTGTNLLIQNGAKMVTSAKDIISDFSGLYEFKVRQGQNNNYPSYKNPEAVVPRENEVKSSAGFNSETSCFDRASSGGDNFGKNNFNKANFDGNNFGNNNLNSVNHDGNKFGKNNFNGVNYAADRRPEILVAAEPRPTILYNGMTEEEAAASYMSVETEINKKPASYIQDTERVYLTYPKEPMPKDGYRIDLSEEGLKSFERRKGVSFKADFADENGFVPITSYKFENDPIRTAASKKAEKKKRLSFKKVKSGENEKAPVSDEKSDKEKILNAARLTTESTLEATTAGAQKSKPEVSYDGLNEMESAVLKFIFEKGSVGIDGMGALDIPVSKLLATVTMLEIKQKITQKPGGYFEIK